MTQKRSRSYCSDGGVPRRSESSERSAGSARWTSGERVSRSTHSASRAARRCARRRRSAHAAAYAQCGAAAASARDCRLTPRRSSARLRETAARSRGTYRFRRMRTLRRQTRTISTSAAASTISTVRGWLPTRSATTTAAACTNGQAMRAAPRVSRKTGRPTSQSRVSQLSIASRDSITAERSALAYSAALANSSASPTPRSSPLAMATRSNRGVCRCGALVESLGELRPKFADATKQKTCGRPAARCCCAAAGTLPPGWRPRAR